ncbi:MAG: SLC13/DASS family transporter [Anaerolineaceae bacterium]|nr:SLC13/DASS family transporter [Anaerolineaceae bacterium]
MFAILVVVLVKELLPLGVVGLGIPFILVVFGLMPANTAMGYFVNSTVVLIAVVYTMSDALTRVGIADRIGQGILYLTNRFSKDNSSKTETLIIVIITLASAIASLALPRYGVTGAFMAVCIAIAKNTKISRTKLLIVLAMAANIWGNNTLLSTPPNMLANGYLEEAAAKTFGFFEFSLIGVPIGIAGTLMLILFKDKTLASNVDEEEMALAEAETVNNKKKKNVPRWRVVGTCLVFILFFLCMMLEDNIGIPSHVTGIFCVALLIGFKLVDERHAYAAVSWDMPFFFGGILAFGKAMETSGASEMLANVIVKVIGNSPSPFFITGVLFTTAALLTQFMSNTGAAGILFPVALAVATKLNADPRAVIMAVTMGCGASFMTPMATVSNTIVMGAGEIKFKDFVIAGIPLMIVMIIICTIGIPLIWPFY